MANYKIATQEGVKKFVKTVLEQKIIPHMMETTITELANYYLQQRSIFDSISINVKLEQLNN